MDIIFLFYKTQSHVGHDMKINNPFKGLRSGSVLNINRKQKYYKNSILTGNHDKQQVGEEGVTSGNATQNLLLHLQ